LLNTTIQHETLKKAKVSYYNSFFKNNRGNIKNTWKGINTIFGKIPQSTKSHSRLLQKMVIPFILNYPDEISNGLNHRSCSIGPMLANWIPLADSKFTDIAHKLIQSSSLNKASGLDGISAKLLKEAGLIVSTSLTYIINRPLPTGFFPDD